MILENPNMTEECCYRRTAIQFSCSEVNGFQLCVNRQVGSLQITLLQSKLHRIETGIVQYPSFAYMQSKKLGIFFPSPNSYIYLIKSLSDVLQGG